MSVEKVDLGIKRIATVEGASEIDFAELTKWGKQASKGLKDVADRDAKQARDIVLKAWSSRENVKTDEVLGYLVNLALVRTAFAKLGVGKREIHEVGLEERRQIAEVAVEHIDRSKVPRRAPLATKFVEALLGSYADAPPERLADAICDLSQSAIGQAILAIEEGAHTYTRQSPAPMEYKPHLRTAIDAIARPAKFVAIYGVDSVYFRKYLPNMMLIARNISSCGGAVYINLMASAQENDFVDRAISTVQNNISFLGGGDEPLQIELSVETVGDNVSKTYYACNRFLTGASVLEKYDAPAMFLDAEMIPQTSFERFLRAIEGRDLIFGGTAGLRSIFPWRRWLSSRFVVSNPSVGREQLTKMANYMLPSVNAKRSWFLDQNAICDLYDDRIAGLNIGHLSGREYFAAQRRSCG